MKYLSLLLIILTFACGEPAEAPVQWMSIEADLQTLIIQAQDGDTIDIPAGNYLFENPLILDGLSDVVFQGQGMDETVLSFELQTSGAEGIRAANCTNLVFQDFTIQDAPGDNIKVTDTDGIRFTNVKSEWIGEPSEENGAYAFYPVLCKRVIVENCLAIGSSDAGIYVGQSDSVVIRDNEVYHNVAGIESENSRWVEIYRNNAHDNTGGILIFDMPGLTQSGHTTRVYDNDVTSNNHDNFAPEGNVVAVVPPGTGIMMMATRNIEVFENRIHHNRTVGTALASYVLVEALGAEEGSQLEEANSQIGEDYDPYPNQVYFHDNEFKNKHWFPTLKNDFGLLFLTYFTFNLPDFAMDGIFPPDKEFVMCLSNNGEFNFANIDAENDFEGRSTDWSEYDCDSGTIEPIFP
ncbi:parallel beta-helix domain-containing protein [Ekhidna sp. To15]|uniref:parallel beta-helix domain-containing protein n=1 Tax=Ekhidna sp. To15 TaxID=3395267 RepID=UPI003F51B129